MPQIILAGGPRHGERLDQVTGEYLDLVTADELFLPATLIPPRPAWWKHPVLWLIWKPPPPFGEATFSQHRYQRRGALPDGTAIYWHTGPAVPPPANDEEVLRVVYKAQASAHPAHRGSMHWEMGPEWFAAIRRASSPHPPHLWEPADVLFAQPVRVSYGPPRLTRYDAP